MSDAFSLTRSLLSAFSLSLLSGSGEANYDSFESNPFQNAKQRQEQEVQTLLQKLSHEMIGLDASFVGAIDKGEIGTGYTRSFGVRQREI